MKNVHGDNRRKTIIIKMDAWTLFWPAVAVVAVAAIGALI